MKRLSMIFLLTVISSICLLGQEQASKKYESLWEGNLNLGPQTLKVILKVIKNNDGTNSAFLDSPDQGAIDIPASGIQITDDSLHFQIRSIGASFKGMFGNEKSIIEGKFKQNMTEFDLTLKKVDKIAEIKRPQLPIKPYPYIEEEVTFPNNEAKITLAGSLTFPKEGNNFPAVVMVTGSGPQDRDESLFNHKVFLVIADHLTRNGIAVLRYDDRGVGKSTGNFSKATTVDFTADALSGVEYLKTRKEIDRNKIGIIGHSEGGIVAPLAAVQSDAVKFIVMLAGTGMKGQDLIPLQTKLLSVAEGVSLEEAEKSADDMKEAFNAIVNAPDSLSAYKKLEEIYYEQISKLSEDEKKKPENNKEAFERLAKQFLSPWFRFFLKYDPRPTLENVTVPVLALNGEKDLQVPAKENLSIIEDALKSGGNKNYKICSLPNLNHVFQTAQTGGVSEYGKIEETFAPAALKTISDWILEITSRK